MKYQNAKIIPCPFCHSTRIGLKNHEVDHKMVMWLWCSNCQATGPVASSEENAMEKWGFESGFDFKAWKSHGI